MSRYLTVAAMLTPALVAASSPEAMAWLDHERLPGTQAMAMSGAITALPEDWTAAWHNPAALAWQRRTEFNLGYEGQRLKDERSVSTDGRKEGARASTSGLSHAGYAHPLPAIRGGLCWAFGWARLADFSQRGVFPDRDWRISQDLAGEHDAWLLSLAGQWSSNLAAGFSLAIHQGQLDRVELEEDFASNEYRRGSDTARVDGISLRLGISVHEGPVRLGLMLEPAHDLNIDWTHREQEGELGTLPPPGTQWGSDYALRVPALLALGAGWSTRFWQVGCSWDWQDWSALSYEDLPAGLDISLSDQLLSRAFQARHRLRLGGEWTIPTTDLRLRGGAWLETPAHAANRLTAWDDAQDSYQYWDYQQEHRRGGWSLGLSWLLQEAIALDVGLARESWERTWLEIEQGLYQSTIRQSVTRWRAQLAIVYRI